MPVVAAVSRVRRCATIAAACALVATLGVVPSGPAWAAPRTDATITCAGNTLTGTLTVTGAAAGTVVTMRVEVQTTGWTTTPLTRTVSVMSGQTAYPYTFDVSGYQTVKAYRLLVAVGSATTQSQRLDRDSCAPPTQVPEVPAPLAIPLTFAATILLTEAVRRRSARTTRDASRA
jgi:hypothetical protein